MELKHSYYRKESGAWVLLIVPYGIETFQLIRVRFIQSLLIVPYGIETFLLQKGIRSLGDF